MNIIINDELLKYIDPLTANEHAALERSLLAEGCRDALVLWGDVLVDGHNRYQICRQHGIAFNTIQNTSFTSLDDVMLWMIDNQLGRRSVSDFQRGVLALRKRDILAARVKAEIDATVEAHGEKTVTADAAMIDADKEEAIPRAPIKTREELARVAGISSNTISQIEKIRKSAAPELVEAVRTGTISINAAAAVASLPNAEQVNAVAGGKKELRQAAKQVREQKAASRPPRADAATIAAAMEGGISGHGIENPSTLRAMIATLNSRVAVLTAENQALQAELAELRAQLAP